MACAVFAVSRAGAQGVDVSSTSRLESVMNVIRARDPKAGHELAARFDVETEPVIRAWIVRGAAVIKAPQGPALFERGLADSSPQVRLAAAEAMAQARGAAAAADLTAALAGEPNAGVRSAIAFWLGTMPTPAAEKGLRQALLGDANANVRAQAARSLKRTGGSAARRDLKRGRSDADARVRAIADEP